MKKLLTLTVFGILAAIAAAPVSAQPVEFVIDKSHQYVGFEASHFGLSPVRGRFDDVDVTLLIDEENAENSRVDVIIQTNSIDTDHGPRDDHLRGADFFNTADYPTMIFAGKALNLSGDSSAKLTGDLTLLGVTKPVTLDFTLTRDIAFPLPGYHNVRTLGFQADGMIKRTDWGMNTYVGEAIADDVRLTIQFDAVQCVGAALAAPSCDFGR